MITVTFNSFADMEKAAYDLTRRLSGEPFPEAEKAQPEQEAAPKKKPKPAEISQKIEDTLPKPEKPTAEKSVEGKTESNVLEHTLVEVRQALYNLRRDSGEKGPALITQILGEFNATSLGQIPHSRYGELLDRVAVLAKGVG